MEPSGSSTEVNGKTKIEKQSVWAGGIAKKLAKFWAFNAGTEANGTQPELNGKELNGRGI